MPVIPVLLVTTKEQFDSTAWCMEYHPHFGLPTEAKDSIKYTNSWLLSRKTLYTINNNYL